MNTVEGIYQDTEDYRDHLATVDQRGKRIWVFPKKPKGRFYNARTWASFVLSATIACPSHGSPCGALALGGLVLCNVKM